MTLPAFVPSIAPDVKTTIQSKLTALETDHDVRILFTIESGSRAWGFPSPDSDYDMRFIYAHQPDWYLSVKPRRDVIELPIEGDWDINDWDIRKALDLLIKPNPVIQDQMQWATDVAKLDDRPDLKAEGDDILRAIVKSNLLDGADL